METTRERTIWDFFNDLRNSYSDEIPTSEINSTSKSNKYKVRTAWFLGISSGAQMLIDLGTIPDDEQKKKLEEFRTYVTSVEFQNRGRTTKEQIDRGNEILDILISLGPKK